MSFEHGDHWQSLQLNLPHSAARDLVIHGNDLIVATHGRGFWILDDMSPLREASSSMANVFLFRPSEAVRVRRSLNPDPPYPADEPYADNPPDGAIINYYLGAASPVTIEILDSSGKLV